jgi:hypothetical protein
MLREFEFEKLLKGLEQGFVFVDFDARTRHNHGTKFRSKQSKLIDLYKQVDVIE